MAWLSINAITCENTQEGRDEIYIKVGLDSAGPERIWGPRNMNDGESLEVNWRQPDADNEFSRYALIQVWEKDMPRLSERRDDLIGQIYVSATPRERQYQFEGNRARYRVSYGVSAESRGVLQWPIHLLRMECNDAKGPRDDVYLLWNERRIWGPVRMRTGDTQPIDHTIVIRDEGTLSLWEQDSRNSDHLGTHVLHSEEYSRPGRPEDPLQFRWRRSRRRDSLYTLYYES